MKAVLFLITILAAHHIALAQNKESPAYLPLGENVLVTRVTPGSNGIPTKYLMVTSKRVITGEELTGGSYSQVTRYNALPKEEIVDAHYRFGDASKIVFLTSNQAIYLLDLNATPVTIPKKLGPVPLLYNTAIDVFGNDLYLLTKRFIYVSRDTPNYLNWTIDTVGLRGSSSFYDACMDTTQKVFLCTNQGLFSQPRFASTWTKLSSVTATPTKVFVSRRQHIWVVASSLLVSTNGGTSFLPAPSGLGANSIESITDDIFGNVYIVQTNPVHGTFLYMSRGGTAAFTSIDTQVKEEFPFEGNGKIYNKISADSALYLSTRAGVYKTVDQGVTWTYWNPVSIEHASSAAATNDNKLLLTTNSGLFRHEGNSTWTKIFPWGKHLSDIKVFTAGNGDIFALAETAHSNSTGAPFRMTYKSSDGGASFVPDTIGAAANNLATTVFLVDKNGIQHAAAYVNNSGSGNAKAVWRKDPGQPWSMDTNGLATLTHVDQPECFGYDEAGTIYYASYNGSQQSTTIFKRAANATTWTMSGVIALYVYEIHGQAGKVIAATDAGLWRFGGTQWVPVNMPQGMPVNQRKYGVNTARFADNGTVWAYIEELSPAAGAIGRGIWYTSDLVNWQYPEPNVDTSWFGALVTMGDSVFVLPRFYDGVYVFSNPPLSVPGTKGKGVLEFVAAPNPVTQKTTLQFSLGKPANAFLRIVDGEGRTIYTSGESHFESGKQFLDLDLRHLSPGMYVCELIVDGQKYQRAILKL